MDPYKDDPTTQAPAQKKSRHVKYPTAQVLHVPVSQQEKKETQDAIKFVQTKLNNITDFIKDQSIIIESEGVELKKKIEELKVQAQKDKDIVTVAQSREDSIAWRITQAEKSEKKDEDLDKLKQDIQSIRLERDIAKASMERTNDFIQFLEKRLVTLLVQQDNVSKSKADLLIEDALQLNESIEHIVTTVCPGLSFVPGSGHSHLQQRKMAQQKEENAYKDQPKRAIKTPGQRRSFGQLLLDFSTGFKF